METSAAPVATPPPAAPAAESQAQESNEGGSEPSEGQIKAKKEAEKIEQRYHKVKINGRERTIREADMLRDYSKALAADERLAQATKMEQASKAFMEELLSDPYKVLSDPRLPIKKRDLAMRILQEEIAEELDAPTDPREIKLREVEGKLKGYEEAEKQKKQSEEQQQRQALIDQRREAIAADLTKALELSVFSKDPAVKAEVLSEMARYMRICKQRGYEVTPQELAEHIQSTHFNRYAALADAHDGESLTKLLGPKVVQKLIEHEIERRKKAMNVSQAPEVAESWQPASRGKREWIDPDELKRRR